MKLGLIFSVVFLAACARQEPPKASAAHAAKHSNDSIAVDISPAKCHESGNQPADPDLKFLVCLSTDQKIVVGVLVHKVYWDLLTKSYYLNN